MKQIDGTEQAVDLTVTPIDKLDTRFLMIVFADVGTPESAHAAGVTPASFEEHMQLPLRELRDEA